MHLKQLKLAGFKSFVEPTVVPFTSQLVAVVGPNGCGKSNIIDAVRWVLGESSAKNLRGESMVDVIFNGSSSRKPLGQASVELVFDNSLGRLTGPFASYGEISLKRVVTRDGDSSYYLNGSRCRKKDITDIFLGTGAGAKGYSIIGQGTISKLIEARPEELRVFLEEAAGVSKYKERRRETLQRMGHTKENLTRIADIKDELGKQLQRLERQAHAAQRYTRLKDEEKNKRADISALKWHELTQLQLEKQAQLQKLAEAFEQQRDFLTQVNAQRSVLNEKIELNSVQLEDVQALFYQVGTDIVRLEETIQQQNREKARLELDRQQKQDDWTEANNQLIQNKENLEDSLQKAQYLETQKEILRTELKIKNDLWQKVQDQKQNWEMANQAFLQQSNEIKREMELARLNLEHTAQKRQQSLLRIEQLQGEQASLSIDVLQQKQQQLEESQAQLKTAYHEEEQQVAHTKDKVAQQRLKIQDLEQTLHQTQDLFYQRNSQLAEVKALQKAAKQANKEPIAEWSDKPRLMDVLAVHPKWQSACELVLGGNLQAYVLPTLDDFWLKQAVCEAQGERVVTLKKPSMVKKSYPKLSDFINGDLPVAMPNFETIYAATNLEEAKTWLAHLSDDESVVTANGVWLGRGWVQCAQVLEKDELGILAGLQKLSELSEEVHALQQRIEELKTTRDTEHGQLQALLQCAEDCQTRFNASTEALRTHQATLTGVEQAILQATARSHHLFVELESQQIVLEETVINQLEQTQRLQDLEANDKEQTVRQAQLLSEKEAWSESWVALSQELDTLRPLVHQAELECDRELTKVQQIKARIVVDEERLVKLQARLEQLAELCLKAMNPDGALHAQLADFVLKQKEMDLQLSLIREQSVQLKAELSTIEKRVLSTDMDVKKTQEAISQGRLQEQELALKASSINDALNELDFDAQTVFLQIPSGVTQSQREEELVVLSQELKKLGAINLAAIEEFDQEQQRKQLLDEQYNDLMQALVSLETAIEQMDKETLARLETTFDEVNGFFKSLFPRLFGGGRAQLELTCDNLLEAGIVVMAQPPGKRNSTIHLLSGGEKALTAVALVFAIFQLNPSPFCMLDEVDAPLDDVNVGRFCDLVKEMSQLVQFLFITHNKVTMELADHLIGVTMREPGVSRLVTVDVKQALTLE